MLRRLAVVLLAVLMGTLAAAAREVTDLAGRTVTLPTSVERIVIGEGRYLPAIAILDRADPTRRVVGMMGEYEQVDPASYARYRAAFPRIDQIMRIGRTSQESFSLEQALALRPQVAIFGLDGHGPGSRSARVIEVLESAGVAVVFIDFRVDPLANTPRSLELLGRVLGREAEAAEFLSAWREAYAQVQERLATARPTPVRVFIESRVGLMPCCETMVRGMMGGFVTAAGGINAAAGIVAGEAGTVSLEYLLTHPPDVYVGTAIGSAASAADNPWIALGPDVSPDVAQSTLARAMGRTGIAQLSAVRTRRAHAIWHHFYNSPFNVAAVQMFAKWLHPELFADLDPDALLRELHRRFQPFAMGGTYWTSLD